MNFPKLKSSLNEFLELPKAMYGQVLSSPAEVSTSIYFRNRI